jgi:RNA polymerase sigma factor (sigma-70 family)
LGRPFKEAGMSKRLDPGKGKDKEPKAVVNVPDVVEIEVKTARGTKTPTETVANGISKVAGSDRKHLSALRNWNKLAKLSEEEQADCFRTIADAVKKIAALFLKLLCFRDKKTPKLRTSFQIKELIDSFRAKYLDFMRANSLEEENDENISKEQARAIAAQVAAFKAKAADVQKEIDAILGRVKNDNDAGYLLDALEAVLGSPSGRLDANSSIGKPQALTNKFSFPLENFGKAFANLNLFIKDVDGVLYEFINDAKERGLVSEICAVNAISDIAGVRLNWSRARKSIAWSNLPLVYKFASRYLGRGISLSDLVGEGSLGLMKAVDRFDPSLGFKLSTYAVWWIRQSFGKYFNFERSLLSVPDYVFENIAKIKNATESFVENSGRKPTTEELAEATSLTPRKVLETLETEALVFNSVSLDSQVLEGAKSTYHDMVEDRNGISPESRALDLENKAELLLILRKTLTKPELNVIVRLYGIPPFRQMSTIEAAMDLGCTKQNVSQLKKCAMELLKSSKEAKRLFTEMIGREPF